MFLWILLACALLPLPALAQDVQDIYATIFRLVGIFISVLYIVMAAAFLWGMALFILNTSDEKKREEGKKWILGAIIVLFVALSLGAIMKFLFGTFGIHPLLVPPLQQ